MKSAVNFTLSSWLSLFQQESFSPDHSVQRTLKVGVQLYLLQVTIPRPHPYPLLVYPCFTYYDTSAYNTVTIKQIIEHTNIESMHTACTTIVFFLAQAMLGAFDAMRGHKSAHSLATGPVTVEPVGQDSQINLSTTLYILLDVVFASAQLWV